jgi:hypothetical protein
MQMYSLFDVESITLTPAKEISEIPEPTYYRKIQVTYKGGTALLTFYSNDKASLEVYHDIKVDK